MRAREAYHTNNMEGQADATVSVRRLGVSGAVLVCVAKLGVSVRRYLQGGH